MEISFDGTSVGRIEFELYSALASLGNCGVTRVTRIAHEEGYRLDEPGRGWFCVFFFS